MHDNRVSSTRNDEKLITVFIRCTPMVTYSIRIQLQQLSFTHRLHFPDETPGCLLQHTQVFSLLFRVIKMVPKDVAIKLQRLGDKGSLEASVPEDWPLSLLLPGQPLASSSPPPGLPARNMFILDNFIKTCMQLDTSQTSMWKWFFPLSWRR